MIYTGLEYLTFAFIFYTFLTGKTVRRIIIVASVLFIFFLIIYYLALTIKLIDSVPIGIESILMFILTFYYFYSSLTNLELEFGIYERASFWFVVGIFVYLGSTFFFNILGSSMEEDEIQKYYYISYLGDIIKNIFFAIAIYLYSKNQLSENKRKSNDSSIPYLDMN